MATVNYSFWDWHGQNFKNAKGELPIFDQGVSVLLKTCTRAAWRKIAPWSFGANLDAPREKSTKTLGATIGPA